MCTVALIYKKKKIFLIQHRIKIIKTNFTFFILSSSVHSVFHSLSVHSVLSSSHLSQALISQPTSRRHRRRLSRAYAVAVSAHAVAVAPYHHSSFVQPHASFTSLSFMSSPPANDTKGHRRNTNRLNGVGLVKKIHSPTSESPRCLSRSLEWRWRAKSPT